VKTIIALSIAAFISSAASAQTTGRTWDRIAGQQTGVNGKSLQTVVIKSQTEWQALWKEHTGGADEAAPAVDFTKEMVVGVFLGERRKAGYAVESKVIVIPTAPGDVTFGPRGDSLVVFYKEIEPKGDGAASASVVTRPFELRKVKKAPIVTFERESLLKAYGRVDTLRLFKDDPRFDR
jgi:hypothetical protein